MKKYKEEIAKELKINIENLIFTDAHHGTVGVHVSIINSNNININTYYYESQILLSRTEQPN